MRCSWSLVVHKLQLRRDVRLRCRLLLPAPSTICFCNITLKARIQSVHHQRIFSHCPCFFRKKLTIFPSLLLTPTTTAPEIPLSLFTHVPESVGCCGLLRRFLWRSLRPDHRVFPRCRDISKKPHLSRTVRTAGKNWSRMLCQQSFRSEVGIHLFSR